MNVVQQDGYYEHRSELLVAAVLRHHLRLVGRQAWVHPEFGDDLRFRALHAHAERGAFRRQPHFRQFVEVVAVHGREAEAVVRVAHEHRAGLRPGDRPHSVVDDPLVQARGVALEGALHDAQHPAAELGHAVEAPFARPQLGDVRPAGDRDLGQVGSHLRERPLLERGGAGLRVVQREGAKHAARGPRQRQRPARPDVVALGQRAEPVPVRLRLHVRRYHLAGGERRGAAGAAIRGYLQAVQRVRVRGGQRRRRDAPQALAALVHQQHRGAHARQLLLHELHDPQQHLVEVGATRDPFQDLRLRREEEPVAFVLETFRTGGCVGRGHRDNARGPKLAASHIVHLLNLEREGSRDIPPTRRQPEASRKLSVAASCSRNSRGLLLRAASSARAYGSANSPARKLPRRRG